MKKAISQEEIRKAEQSKRGSGGGGGGGDGYPGYYPPMRDAPYGNRGPPYGGRGGGYDSYRMSGGH